jgi:hypothetical protein
LRREGDEVGEFRTSFVAGTLLTLGIGDQEFPVRPLPRFVNLIRALPRAV